MTSIELINANLKNISRVQTLYYSDHPKAISIYCKPLLSLFHEVYQFTIFVFGVDQSSILYIENNKENRPYFI